MRGTSKYVLTPWFLKNVIWTEANPTAISSPNISYCTRATFLVTGSRDESVTKKYSLLLSAFRLSTRLDENGVYSDTMRQLGLKTLFVRRTPR